jgi:hypothetical protein
MPAGVRVAARSVGGPEHPVTVGFDTLVVEVPGEPPARKLPGVHTIDADALARLAATGAAAQADLRTAGRDKFAGPDQQVAVQAPSYAVVDRNDLRAAAGVPASDGSWTGASEALRRYTAGRPDRAERVQLVPDHEVRA